MLVRCDKCGQAYDVNESRLSSKGARIKCPSCANVFMVNAHGAPVSGVDATVSAQHAAVSKSAGTPVTERQAEQFSELKPQAPDEGTTWKVRHIGLTYTFHDLSSLHEWLGGRSSLDDVKIAKDEGEWKELGDFPGILTTELITRFFPLGDVPTSKAGGGSAGGEKELVGKPYNGLRATSSVGLGGEPLGVSTNLSDPVVSSRLKRPTRKEQQARQKAKATVRNTVILIVSLIVLFAVVVICVVKFMRSDAPVLPEKSEMQAVEKPPVPAVRNDAPEVKPEPAEADPAVQERDKESQDGASADDIETLAELELQKQLSEAEDMVNNRQWPEARTTLEQLLKDMPDHIEAMQMLVKTYRGLDLNDKAAEMESAIKRIQEGKK